MTLHIIKQLLYDRVLVFETIVVSIPQTLTVHKFGPSSIFFLLNSYMQISIPYFLRWCGIALETNGVLFSASVMEGNSSRLPK